jgi:hypothetical protein
MRVVLKEYANGGRNAYETTNDGGEVVSNWSGPVKVGERIGGFIEAACDDTEEGYRRLLEPMAWLAEEIKKRKLQPAAVG